MKFTEGVCMNCGATIYYSWQGVHKKFYSPEYSNRPVDKYNVNEITPYCPRCSIKLDDKQVINKKIFEEDK